MSFPRPVYSWLNPAFINLFDHLKVNFNFTENDILMIVTCVHVQMNFDAGGKTKIPEMRYSSKP
jgi:hypothetical protein